MLIEEELQQFLDHSIQSGNNKLRDKKIITFYYGFGESSWPTLEEVAGAFGLNQRERVRQIIKYKFQDVATANSLPRASFAAAQINGFEFISAAEIQAILIDKDLSDEETSLRGLLNLLQDLNLCRDFNIYDAALRPVTRAASGHQASCFLIRSSRLPVLKKARKRAVKLPGLLGLAKAVYIDRELQEFDELIPLQIRTLLEADRNACVVDVANERWFALEGRDNTLINSCEKLFGVVSACDVSILANVLRNSLSKRSHRLEYPTVHAIERFLEMSREFDIHDGSVTFRGQATELTPIEKEVVAYLQKHGVVDYPQIRDHLDSKGYRKPHIDKAVTCSPLVYVDKSLGRTRYTYQLVSTVSQPAPDPFNSYQLIQARLRRLHELGTDINCESSRRREQAILQDWLFSGKSVELCAICGKTFSCSALVAAHKKTRSTCSEKERLDPHIVMPLCVFGCDYLYEKRYLVVSGDTIVLGAAMSKTHESIFASSLAGRKIPEQWLLGDPSYFSRQQNQSLSAEAKDPIYAET